MKAMIQNDSDNAWMRPLLELRNELDFRGDAGRTRDLSRRDFRRLRGSPELNRAGDDLVPGPYTQETRTELLEHLLRIQTIIRTNPRTPEALRSIELISLRELKAIRRLWLETKHEIEDLMPRIYERATGTKFPEAGDEVPFLDAEALRILETAASGDRLHYETLRNLLDAEYQYRKGGTAIARRGLFKELQSTIEAGFFVDRADALEWAKASARPQEEANEDLPHHRIESAYTDRNDEGEAEQLELIAEMGGSTNAL